MSFSSDLIVWYKQYKRDLPWRKTKDPYRVWISEIVLQQTRVNQGLKYYNEIVEKYSNVHALAKADEDEVFRLWQGLGYYSRARNMHFTAKYVSNELNGHFPKTYNELIKLKGIGRYTAAAISSICFNEHRSVLDGNVFRVLSRVFGVDEPINSLQGKKKFEELAHELNDGGDSGTYNQAIMEFGALQCTPKKAMCDKCIFSYRCYAYKNNKVDELPVKKNKIVVKERFLNFFFVHDASGKALVKKRADKDIWRGLYQIVLKETSMRIDGYQMVNELFSYSGENVVIKGFEESTHKLTHQKLYIQIIDVAIKDIEIGMFDGYEEVDFKELKKLAFPKPLESFFNKKFGTG